MSLSITVNSPQFPIAVTNISSASMQHGSIITDQQITPLPTKANTDSIVIYDAIHNLDQTIVVILN